MKQIGQAAGVMMSPINLLAPCLPCPSTQVISLCGCLCVCASFSCVETNMVDGGIRDDSSCKLHDLHVCLMTYAMSVLFTCMYDIHVYCSLSKNSAK